TMQVAQAQHQQLAQLGQQRATHQNALQQRQAQEISQRWAKFSSEEDSKFSKAVPEMADAKTAYEVQARTQKMLKGIGLGDEELRKMWFGQEGISLRDHRAQLILHKAAMWDEAQARSKKAKQRSLPPVLKPGVRPAGAVDHDNISSLERRL